MEVRPDRASESASLEARGPVVAEPVLDSSERLGTGVEQRPARVVLEARQRPSNVGIELALEEDVTDHPRLACDRLVGEERRARHERPVATPVAASEELVSTTHREQGDAALLRRSDRISLRRQIGSDECLFTILSSAHVEQVVRRRVELVGESDRPNVELVSRRGRETKK